MRQRLFSTKSVNEVLAFALIFALILTSISLIYTQAYPQLQQQKNVEIETNVERSLSILQQNFNTVFTGRAPSRATELKVGNSQLNITAGYNVTYSFKRNGNYSNVSVTPDVLEYETQTGSEYYYFNTAIVQKGNGHMYFVEEPTTIKTKNGSLLIDSVGLNHQGSLLSGGTHTVQVTGGDGQVIIRQPRPGNETHTMTLWMDTPTKQERDFWMNHYNDKQTFTNCYKATATAFSCETVPYEEIIISYRLLTYEYLN